MSGIRNERFSWMIRPRKPWPRGRAPIRARVARAHPARDEALDDTVLVDDPERGVLRPDQRPDLVDDDLEDLVDRQQAGDRPRRGIEGIEDRELGQVVGTVGHGRRA